MEELSVSSIKDSLETEFVGNDIYVFQSVSSTQDVARELLKKGAIEGTVVLAETQTKGRGRFGRNWVSPREVGIWASVILHPDRFFNKNKTSQNSQYTTSADNDQQGFEISSPQYTASAGSVTGNTMMFDRGCLTISLTCGVAIANAIRQVTGLRSFVKWPNDVLLHRKKVAGILVEVVGESVIVGLGINVNQEQFPEFLMDSATSLRIESGKQVSRISLMREVLHQLEHYYIILREEGFAPVVEKMRDISAVLGRQVAASFNGKKFAGQAVDIDIDGALLIRLDSGVQMRVVTGDVSII